MRKVDVDAVVVNQHALHFEVGALAVFFAAEFDEGVLQAVTCLLVPDDFARQDLAEAREDEF